MCYFRHIKTGLAQSPLRLILASGQTIPNVSREHFKNLQRNKIKTSMLSGCLRFKAREQSKSSQKRQTEWHGYTLEADSFSLLTIDLFVNLQTSHTGT